MFRNPDSYDIAIIGGGLAGLSAAVAIGAGSEAQVVLIDKDIGHNNPTPLTFSDVVQRFGLEDSVVNRYRGFSLHSSLGSQSIHYYHNFPLVSLDYKGACYLLLARARQSPQFTWERAHANSLAREHGEWVINLSNGRKVRAALLIDASGKAHFAAHHLRLARSRMYSHCYGQFFIGCQFTNHELAEDVCLFLGGSERFGNGGGWCYPLGIGRISFGFATVTDSPHYPLRLVRQRYQRALQEFAPYADILARGRPGPVERGSIPIGPVRRFVYDGLMLAGDAAGQATPWACMGVEPALVNGQTCGRVAAQAFKQGDFQAKALQEYETIWAQANRRSYRQGTILAPLQWTQGEEVWDKIAARHSRFTPEETLAHLRYNEPIHSLPVVGWSMIYDRLGQVRRGIGDWIRRTHRNITEKTMARLVDRLGTVDQPDYPEVWTRANIAEVLPGVVTPLTWSVFQTNLLCHPLSKIEAENGSNGQIRLIKGRAYLRLDALLGSFCCLPGVGPDTVHQALGVDQKEVHRDDDWKPESNLLARLGGGLFLAEVLGLSPVLSLQLARLDAPPTDKSPTEEYVSTPLATLVGRIEKLIDWNTRCFQLHLKCTRYAIGAYGLLTYMLRHWLPDAEASLAHWQGSRTERETNFATSEGHARTKLEADLLTSQAELQMAEQGLALWRLAEQARAHPNVAAVLKNGVNWTTTQRILQDTEGGRKFLEALATFLTKHGARTVEEFELASPRWREDPTFVLTVIRNYLHANPAFNPTATLHQHRALRDVTTAWIVRQMSPLKGWLFHRVLRAYKAYLPLRENMKYRLMEGYEALRHSFLDLGDCLCAAGVLDSKEDIFFLTAGEALAAGRDGAVSAGEIRAKVNRHRVERTRQERFQPPEMILGNDLVWVLDNNGLETLQGIACSPGYVVGKARVIQEITMASRLQPGEILVAPSTDPGWTPLFLTAAAVVTDIGGFLSHGATVAREYGIPAVANTKRASKLVKNGQVIIVDGNQGVVYLPHQNLFGCG